MHLAICCSVAWLALTEKARTEQGLQGNEEVSQADVGEEHPGKGKS